MKTVNAMTQAALLALLQQAGLPTNSSVAQQDIGYFLENYIVDGFELTIDAANKRKFSLSEGVVALDRSLFAVANKATELYGPHTVTYVDVTETGLSINTSHPATTYLPVWTINTDVNGNILSTVDHRGTGGFLKFREEIMGLVTDALIVDNAHVANDAISTGKIQNDAVTQDKIADLAVGNAQLINDSVTSDKIAGGSVGNSKLANESVTVEKMAPGSVGSAQMIDGSVGTAELADLSVNTEKLKDQAVTINKMANNSVGSSQILNSAIDNSHMANNSIGTDELQDNSVTASKLTTNSVGPNHIQDNAITNSKMADNSVGAAELIDGSVNGNKIENYSVTSDKIGMNAVGSYALGPDAVIAEKIKNGAVTRSKIPIGTLDDEYYTLANGALFQANLLAALESERQSRINSDGIEISARIAGDALEANLRQTADDAEKAARIAADNLEASARQSADNAETAARIAADNTEATARANADTSHAANTSAHNASQIVFTPGTSGLSSTKADTAIKEVNSRISAIIVGAPIQSVADALVSAITGVTYANLKARLDAEGFGDRTQLTTDVKTSGVAAVNEVSSFVESVNVAQADIARSIRHSGVTSLSAITYLPTTPNKFKFASDQVHDVNGYKVTIPKDTEITLPTAPTFGTRDDLVFLEAWFPTTGTKGVLSWRLRLVDNVDFIKYPEGIARNTGSFQESYNGNIYVQGGNSSPLVTHVTHPYGSFMSSAKRSETGLGITNIGVGDVGLYVAGLGDTASKTTLATADGYVYAIPLFRIKNRRNSGGWRADNPNGARDYVSLGSLNGLLSQNLIVGQETTIAVASERYQATLIGDKFRRADTDTRDFIVINKPTTNNLTIRAIGTGDVLSGSGQVYNLISDRPDGAFANTILADDIIDLRHKVSRISESQVLEEAFTAIQQNTLQTKDTKTTVRETYGVMKAPFYVPQALQEVEIKRADGTSAKLRNLLGVEGNFEVDSDRNGYADGWTTAGSVSSPLLNTSAVEIGQKYQTFTTGASGAGIQHIIKTDVGKNYLAVTRIKTTITTPNGTQIRIYRGATNAFTSSPLSASSSWTTIYVKFVADGTEDTIRLNSSGVGGTIDTDGVRLYEISAAEYALIDVDPNYTGGDKISALFPYVDSLPNYVENFLDKSTATAGFFVNASTGGLSSSVDNYYSEYLPVKPSTTYKAWGNPNAPSNRGAFYDSSKTFISGLAVNDFTTPSNAVFMRVSIHKNDLDTHIIEQGSVASPVYVPYGKHYIPADYQGYNTHLGNNGLLHYDGVNGGQFHANRSVFSDALTSETRTDIVEALKTPQSHIKVTQVTEGQWAIGDKIIISSANVGGVISGVVSGVGALRITEAITSTSSPVTIKVNTTTGVTVGDKFIRRNFNDFSQYTNVEITVSSIDTSNNTVTFTWGGEVLGFSEGIYLVKIVNPPVTATGIAGTWTGLGTKEATYTLTAAPTTNTTNISLAYSINYPAGKGLTHLPTDVLSAEVNGQKLVSGQTVSVKANFVGKISGNSDANPHVYRRSATSTLISGGTGTENAQSSYDSISLLDGSVYSNIGSSSGIIAQQQFSFDLIRLIEDKYGEGIFADCADTAQKVNKLKGTAPFASPLVSKITGNWWGYGSGPLGNKATFNFYRSDVGWTYFPTSHTNSSVTKLSRFADTQPTVSQIIQSDGFVHFLAYADASDGVTASTINTAYFELDVELNVAETGFTVLQPENPFPVLSENLLTLNQAFPVNTADFSTNGAATNTIDSPGVIKTTTPSSISGEGLTLVINNNITRGKPVTGRVKLRGTGTVSVNFRDTTNAVNGSSTQVTLSDTWQEVTIPTFTFPTSNTGALIRVLTSSQQEATIYAKDFVLSEGTISKPWSAGRKKKVTLNMLGKVAGSLSTPHRMLYKTAATFDAPSTFTAEASQIEYDSISKQDGVIYTLPAIGEGMFPQVVLEIDFSHLGMSQSEIKKALRSWSCSLTLRGEGNNDGAVGRGTVLKFWDNSTSSWATEILDPSSTMKTLVWSRTNNAALAKYVNNNQKAYLLIHPIWAANESTESILFIDYANLDATLADYVDYVKSNIVKVQPSTKTIKLAFPARSYRSLGGGANSDVVNLNYRYIPKQAEVIGAPDKDLTKPNFFFATTLGTGGYTTELNSILAQILSNPSDYTGQTLHSFITKGTKMFPFETDDQRAAKPSIVSPYVVYAYKLVVKNSQLYLRIMYRESKNLTAAVDLTQSIDFPVPGRPLVKGV